MELLFLWISEYLNIANRGFTFSSKYLFEWESDIDGKRFNLKIKKNQDDIVDFFGANILNVIGIVGANGTGKSNLLDYLMVFLTNGTEQGEDWLAVFYDKKNNQLKVYHSLFEFDIKKMLVSRSESWDIKIATEEPYRLNQAEIGELNVWDQAHLYGVRDLESIRALFYSPFLDMRHIPEMKSDAFDKIINVCQNQLLNQDINSTIFQEERDNIVERHKIMNVERQFQFVSENLDFVQQVNLPSQLDIRFYKRPEIDTSDLGFTARDFYKKFDQKVRDEMGEPNHLMSQGKEKRSNKIYLQGRRQKVKLWFLRNLVNNFLHNLSDYKFLNDEKTKFKIEDFDFRNTSPEDLAKSFFEKQTLIAQGKFDFTEFINYIFKVIDRNAKFDSRNDNEAYFNVSVEIGQELVQLHYQYTTSFKNEAVGFMGTDWRTISSGEKAFLDLFSRLDYGLKQAETQHLLKKNSVIYVLLDEGDVSFHPRWQKEYLSKILAFFTNKTQYKYQLFLTTHSPYLISDLPHFNVLMLQHQENASDRLGFTKHAKTFGANIHELLSESFFMGDTLFGDFAYQKIKEIFLWYKNEMDLNGDYVKKLIDLVDEPLLNYKLQQLYNEKTGNNSEAERLRNQINNLQKRLDQIEPNNDSDRRKR